MDALLEVIVVFFQHPQEGPESQDLRLVYGVNALPLVNAVFFSLAFGMIEGFVAKLGAYGFRFFVIESVHVVSFWSFWETPLSAKKRYSSPISNGHPKFRHRQDSYLFSFMNIIFINE